MSQLRGWRSKTPVDLEDLDQPASRELLMPPSAQYSLQKQTRIYKGASTFNQNTEAVNAVKTAISDGADFNRLVATHPAGALAALRNLAVNKIGTFESRDTYVARAFKDSILLTRGMDSPEDSNYSQNWQNLIKTEARSHLMKEESGLHEPVLLTAYSVNIQDAAAPLERGVLRALLKSERRDGVVDEIWDLPAVLAIIEYKWDYWARKYLIIEFILYLGWLLGFVAYLIIYIEEDLSDGFGHMSTGNLSVAVFAFFVDLLSVAFMLPFLVIEYNSIMYYKLQWFQMWNMIDALAYALQGIITVNHCIHFQLQEKVYSTLLALQCTILFIKVQYFLRVMGVGASYIETLRILLYDVRYFLGFIVLMTASATLSLAVLYKEENDNKDKIENFDESLEDFASVPRALVSTYAILLGNFESSYISDTRNRVVKAVFFLLFQLFMAITILNLLIAVMTDSYANIMKIKRRLYNRGKAQLIDELEINLPKMFLGKLKPYVHFAVVTPVDEQQEENLISTTSLTSQESSMNEMKSKLHEVEKLVKVLNAKIDKLQPSQ